MKLSLPVFILALLMMLVGTAGANSFQTQAIDGEWTLEKDKDGVQVYSKPVKGSPINAIRGETTIRASLSQIVTVLRDPALRPEWDELCGDAYVLKNITEIEELVYVHTRLPWPIKDRDMLMRVSWSQNPGSLTVSMDGKATDKLMPDTKGRVRVTTASNQWDLTPVGDGQVRVVTTVHVDPAGPLPAWLINTLSIDSPFTSLKKIGQLVAKKSFKPQVFDFIREPS